MNKTVTILLASLLTVMVGCAGYEPLVSMRGTEVSAADKAPDQKQYSERSPGAGSPELIRRTFAEQPPLIPHAVEKYEPITLKANDCLDCHVSDEFKGRKMPKMGDSHFSKTRKEADGSLAVDMARWQCLGCHVPQVNAPALVENRFIGDIK
ncbi:MAG: nitrate reductase cytochrome c-type subunit; periplasmic nitrate reductase electron transfer subunit [Rhodocyclaceae bacterium]|nr:MAG: nitrate reductase cytochrome c-type subunit; periplasmic nitrate reductase electron transfer subunit [Rhodocyclaceae bacterium]